ncbi:MAG: hypothetical protein U0269_17050 [Polyangiales bacterium]
MSHAPGLHLFARSAGLVVVLVTDNGLTLRWTIDRDRCVWLQLDNGARCPALALDSALALPTSVVIAAACNVESVERPARGELVGRMVANDVIDEETGEVLVEASQRVSDRVDFAAVSAPVELVVTEHEARARCLEATRAEANRNWIVAPFGAALDGLVENVATAVRSGEIPIGPRCASALDDLVGDRERGATTLTSADLVHIWLQFSSETSR